MNIRPLSCTLFLSAALLGTGCSDSNGTINHDRNGADDGGGPGNDGGPGSLCLSTGTACSTSSGGVCCSGICNNSVCANPIYCTGPASSCSVNTDCCSNHCVNGGCSAQQCFDVGMPCGANTDCCTHTCTSGTCAQIPNSPGTCKVIGQACASAADCCSTNCQGGVCVRAYSCQANGDICLRDSDCCGNACSANDGGAGNCLQINGGGGGGCLQDGNPCSGGTNCCSRTCVNPGSGTTVCQPVDGCRLTGDFCLSTSACCGGGPNPNGTVQCNGGRCDNGQACNGVGNICGSATLPDGGILTINASQDWCDGKTTVCKVDSNGVPRCVGGCPGGTCSSSCPTGYTGQAPCCIATNQACQFSDQCCGGARCLPGDGGFFCTVPTCRGVGTTCDAGSNECCNGTQCLRTGGGEFGVTYACQAPPPPYDAGVPDGGGACLANGTSCDGGMSCCSQICASGACRAPAVCQPLSGVCTATADCCSGLSCSVPSGSTTGTCQSGSCPGLGQSCSAQVACCTGLNCLNTSGVSCSISDPSCSCASSLN